MISRKPIHFQSWIDENRHLLKPPVGNKVVFQNTEFIVMVVGGPNSRKDFHYDEGEEFFYMIEGDMLLRVMDEGKLVDIPIRQGEIYLLPPRIPHNPIRFPNTVGLVMERRRRKGEKDGLMWFCEICSEKLYEEFFELGDIENQFQAVFQRFYSSHDLRKCKKCHSLMEPPR